MIFRKRQQSLEIIIGPESSVTGNLSTPGIARIDGNVEGNIAEYWLIVGETGCMKGDAVSRGTMVAGKLEGSIRASESVEIGSKGIVAGDIYTTKLSISEGACFDGHSYMRRLWNWTAERCCPSKKVENQVWALPRNRAASMSPDPLIDCRRSRTRMLRRRQTKKD